MLHALLVCFILNLSSVALYQLNATDYNEFPPLFYLDDYESCLKLPGGVYCDVQLNLVSDKHSQLLTLIQSHYSDNYYIHFNHTKLQYGVCVTQTCKKHINNEFSIRDPKHILEECFNESLWEKYNLKTLVNEAKCRRNNDVIQIDMTDILVAVIFASLFLLNITGSFYDIYYKIRRKKNENLFLQSFSIINNFKRLLAPVTMTERKDCLGGINGLRTFIGILVILGHTPAIFVIGAINPRDLEKAYDNLLYYILLNGPLAVQSFFVLSSFLLAYNFQILIEKDKVSWSWIPKGIILRWLRFIPAYGMLLAFICTWLRFLYDGPLWQRAVMGEVEDCRHKWWANILYVNNYIDTQCMPQSWYLAANFQLSIVALILCVFLSYSSAKKLVLSFIFLIGLLFPALQTYCQDLDAGLLISPEVGRDFYKSSQKLIPTYRNGLSNLASPIIGVALGYWIYSLQQKNFEIQKYQKYRVLYWSIIPTMFAMTMAASTFYQLPRPSLLIRVLYAALSKPAFGLLISAIIFGMVFKYEKVYRSFFEWHYWGSLNRLTYTVYLFNMLIIRIAAGTRNTLVTVSSYYLITYFFGVLGATYSIAALFWMFVEAPIASVIKLTFIQPQLIKENNNCKITTEKERINLKKIE